MADAKRLSPNFHLFYLCEMIKVNIFMCSSALAVIVSLYNNHNNNDIFINANSSGMPNVG